MKAEQSGQPKPSIASLLSSTSIAAAGLPLPLFGNFTTAFTMDSQPVRLIGFDDDHALNDILAGFGLSANYRYFLPII